MADNPLNKLDKYVRDRKIKEQKKIEEMMTKKDVEKVHSQYIRKSLCGDSTHQRPMPYIPTPSRKTLVNKGPGSVMKLKCPVVGCFIHFTTNQEYLKHRSTAGPVVHSPCNPLRHLPNGKIDTMTTAHICPVCGALYRNLVYCEEHMAATEHNILQEALPLAGYICPQCLNVYPDHGACEEHMDTEKHYYIQYPFGDDLNPDNPVHPVPLPRSTLRIFVEKCAAVSCSYVGSNTVTADMNHGEVFAFLLKVATCIQCLRLFDEIPPTDPIHHCSNSIKGLYIENNCKSFEEFIRRLGLSSIPQIPTQPRNETDEVIILDSEYKNILPEATAGSGEKLSKKRRISDNSSDRGSKRNTGDSNYGNSSNVESKRNSTYSNYGNLQSKQADIIILSDDDIFEPIRKQNRYLCKTMMDIQILEPTVVQDLNNNYVLKPEISVIDEQTSTVIDKHTSTFHGPLHKVEDKNQIHTDETAVPSVSIHIFKEEKQTHTDETAAPSVSLHIFKEEIQSHTEENAAPSVSIQGRDLHKSDVSGTESHTSSSHGPLHILKEENQTHTDETAAPSVSIQGNDMQKLVSTTQISVEQKAVGKDLCVKQETGSLAGKDKTNGPFSEAKICDVNEGPLIKDVRNLSIVSNMSTVDMGRAQTEVSNPDLTEVKPTIYPVKGNNDKSDDPSRCTFERKLLPCLQWFVGCRHPQCVCQGTIFKYTTVQVKILPFLRKFKNMCLLEDSASFIKKKVLWETFRKFWCFDQSYRKCILQSNFFVLFYILYSVRRCKIFVYGFKVSAAFLKEATTSRVLSPSNGVLAPSTGWSICTDSAVKRKYNYQSVGTINNSKNNCETFASISNKLKIDCNKSCASKCDALPVKCTKPIVEETTTYFTKSMTSKSTSILPKTTSSKSTSILPKTTSSKSCTAIEGRDLSSVLVPNSSVAEFSKTENSVCKNKRKKGLKESKDTRRNLFIERLNVLDVFRQVIKESQSKGNVSSPLYSSPSPKKKRKLTTKTHIFEHDELKGTSKKTNEGKKYSKSGKRKGTTSKTPPNSEENTTSKTPPNNEENTTPKISKTGKTGKKSKPKTDPNVSDDVNITRDLERKTDENETITTTELNSSVNRILSTSIEDIKSPVVSSDKGKKRKATKNEPSLFKKPVNKGLTKEETYSSDLCLSSGKGKRKEKKLKKSEKPVKFEKSDDGSVAQEQIISPESPSVKTKGKKAKKNKS